MSATEPRATPRHGEATISGRLAAHVADTRWEDLPADAIAASKRLGLDTLAVAWAGATAPGVPPVRDLLVDEGGKGESLLWADGRRLPARAAAFINSAAAAALDYDGMRATERGSVHADSVVLPAALAIAEREHASGRDFLTALVIGNDLVTRLGAASLLPHKGWYLTSIYGVFGATAAAAKLLKLDAAKTTHAFGIALSQASCTQLPNIERNLTKRFSSSFAAAAGVSSALLAAAGVTAPREAFEGQFGFYRLYQDGDADALLANLGRDYPHVGTAIKKYPSCACNHTAIEATLDLVREHGLTAADATEIEVTISPYVDRLVGASFDPGADPQVAAQFSVQYSVACPLLRGRFGVADIQPDAVTAPDIVALARRIAVRIDPGWNNSRAATVRIVSRTRGTLEKHVAHIPGTPEAPLGDAELQAKIRDCFDFGARAGEDPRQIARAWYAIEDCPDIAALWRG
ncbi:MAG: MmgE/PrpD family protein [Burkholderiales bacterium]